MTNFSKTAAIREARTFVGAPTRRSSTDYVVYGPYRSTQPNGPSTEQQSDSYPKALAIRTRWVARIALHLMDALDDDASAAIEFSEAATIEALVDIGLTAHRKAVNA